MKKQSLLLVVFVLILPFVMAACGGGDVSEDDAEKAIKAAFEGDADEANKFLCDADKVEDGDMPEGITVENISCAKDGDDMKCDVNISMAIEGAEPQTFEQSITFGVEDGKLCGGDFAAAQ